jgi:hypothetical protein
MFAVHALLSCTPRLPLKTISSHPPINLSVPRPIVIESSAKARPEWAAARSGKGEGGGDTTAFLGQGAGSTLDEARAAAKRDLTDAIASFVSVDVASDFEAEQTESSSGGDVRQTTEVHAEVRANRDKSAVGEVKIEDSYWEHVEIPGKEGEGDSYRVFVRARLGLVDLACARALKLLARTTSGRSTIAVLPFDAPKGEEKVARALANETARRLVEDPAIAVLGPDIVDLVVPVHLRDRTADERAAIVEAHLHPRAMLVGAIERDGAARIRIRWRLLASGSPKPERSIASEDVFGVEEMLIADIRRELEGVR